MGSAGQVSASHQTASEWLAFRGAVRAGPPAPQVDPQRNRLALPPDTRHRHAAWSRHEPSLPALRRRGIFAPGHAPRIEGASLHVALEDSTFGRPNVRCTCQRLRHQVSRLAPPSL